MSKCAVPKVFDGVFRTIPPQTTKAIAENWIAANRLPNTGLANPELISMENMQGRG